MALALPLTYLLPTHLLLEELHSLEEQIPTLTDDITEAKLVVGKVGTKQRALFELRSRKLWTDEVSIAKDEAQEEVSEPRGVQHHGPVLKRRKLDHARPNVIDANSCSESDSEVDTEKGYTTASEYQHSDQINPPALFISGPAALGSSSSTAGSVDHKPDIEWGDTVKVVRLAWLIECLAVGRLLPFSNYLVYEGRPVRQSQQVSSGLTITKITKGQPVTDGILSRAKADSPKQNSNLFSKRGITGLHRRRSSPKRVTRPTQLIRQTTSEHENSDQLPPLPEYLHTTYSCQRSTPMNPPNNLFIDQLKKIRTGRILEGDEIGVRAYSTAIASIAAYPYILTSTQEVLRLPGCDQKVAYLYQQWKDEGHITAVCDIESDPKMLVLHLFYNIWGVGAITAREFYNKGWRDLEDVVEYGWAALTRVQQIGVKYYEEFQIKIPREEVEAISFTIFSYANKIHPGFHMCIVGGYRRGKSESGDVDVILSHPNPTFTLGFIQDIIAELENAQWISHTLLLSMANSERGQTPVSWKGEARKRGSGFDTLDKALLVWQNPNWPTREADLAKNPKAKNPNIHRRVDIIISPWRTAGCAVAGWTSGTTFQRDLRRYVRKVKNFRFDSSGIRSKEDGHWVDLESVGGPAPDLLTAEKRVFAGLELEWREPNERCTG